jgi:Protein of unknown function (DUF3738)
LTLPSVNFARGLMRDWIFFLDRLSRFLSLCLGTRLLLDRFATWWFRRNDPLCRIAEVLKDASACLTSLPRICGGFSGDYLYGTTMARLCGQFSALLDQDVIDKTVIAGAFDIQPESFWANLHPGAPAYGTPRRSNPAASPAPPDLADKLTAARSAVEKLGLKLEPAKGSGEFLVIDHVERPSEN